MSASRRAFLLGAAALGALLPRSRAWAGKKPAEPPPPPPAPAGTTAPTPTHTGPFVLPPLPYAEDALAPVISAQTVSFHYGKHHRGYVDNLNKLVADTPHAAESLDAVVRASAGNAEKVAIFNNAAQIAHHTFYWESMKPGGGGAPPAGPVADLVAAAGGWDKVRAELAEKATRLFGSGWCWLVLDAGALKVVQTKNADLPPGKPLLVIDVWEHAYYLDHQNRRADYVNGWLDELVSWDAAAKRLAG